MKFSPTSVRILAIAAVVAVGAYGVAWFMPKTYRANSKLYFPQAQSGGSGGALAALRGEGASGDSAVPLFEGALRVVSVGSSSQTAIEILKSRTCLREVVRKLSLAQKWEESEKKAIEKLDDQVDAKIEKSGLVTVTADAENSKLSEQIVAAMLNHLGTRAKQLSSGSEENGRAFVAKKVEEAEKKVADTKAEMERVMAVSPFSNAQEVSRRYLAAADTLADATAQRAKAYAAFSELRSGAERAFAETGNIEGKIAAYRTLSQSLQGAASALQEKNTQLKQTLSVYTEDSPEAKAIRNELAILEGTAKAQEKAEKAIVGQNLTAEQRRASSDLSGLDASIATLKRTMATYERALAESPRQYASVTVAQSDFQLALESRNRLIGQLQLAEIAEGRDPAIFEVVDEPEAGSEPVAPSKGKIALGFFLLALALQAAPVLSQKLKDQPE